MQEITAPHTSLQLNLWRPRNMKRQLFALAAGAMLLLTPALSQMATAQNSAAPTKAERSAKWKEFQTSLNLTDTQKAQLKQIRQNTRAKIEAILTPEQKAQLQAKRAASDKKRGRPMDKLKTLNLTADQKAQMKKVRQEAKEQMQAVFTPEQKAILEKYRANNPRREKAPQ
jgi:periplasmic protein CpxP/Spy